MIAKQVKGRGFRGTLNYLLQKPEAELIGGNMLGETPRELAAEFAESRKLRPNLERAVYHASLSLAPGEKFSDEKWREVAGHYTKEMGIEGSQYAVIRHKDTEHDHVHIVASRIRMDGGVVSDSQDYKRSEKVVRGLEIENGLTRVPNSDEVLRRAPTGDEFRAALRTKTPSSRMQLQGLIDHAIQGNPSVSDFFSRLESMGVEPIPNIAETGHVSGISYRLDKKEVMKGSDLGRGYSWQGIQKRGVTYGREGNRINQTEGNQDRDLETINRAAQRGKTILGREREEEDRPTLGAQSRPLQHALRQTAVRRESGGDVQDSSPTSRLDVGTGPRKQAHVKRDEGHSRDGTAGVTGALRRIKTKDGGASRGDYHPHMEGVGSGNLGGGLKRPSDLSHIQSLSEILRHGKSRRQAEEEHKIAEERRIASEERQRTREEERKKELERRKSLGLDGPHRGGGRGR